MPRILPLRNLHHHPLLHRKSPSQKHLLQSLLRTTGSVAVAARELQWLRDHVKATLDHHQHHHHHHHNDHHSNATGPTTAYLASSASASASAGASARANSQLCNLVRQRSRGVPLQYLLGTEFFGALELECQPGVLIPRPATADAVTQVWRRAGAEKRLLWRRRLEEGKWSTTAGAGAGAGAAADGVRVLDLCSGSGCVALLSAWEFPFDEMGLGSVEIRGVDVEDVCLQLANVNKERVLELAKGQRKKQAVIETLQKLQFVKGDVLKPGAITGKWDVILANPPYISPICFKTVTDYSVRKWEPKKALVPEGSGTDNEIADMFYPAILKMAQELDNQILWMELSDLDQAIRVVSLAKQQNIWDIIEIWRDDPNPEHSYRDESNQINIIGQGEARSVFLCKKMA